MANTMIIKAPAYEDPSEKKSFICTDDGLFPDVEDCQMFWFCEFKKDFDANPVTSKIEEIAESVATSFEPVRLFKCPKGYVYDDNVKFCQPSEEVRCLYPRKQEEKEELISPWGTLNDFR